MKISNDTRNVLKNFSTINSGIRVKSGNKLETISKEEVTSKTNVYFVPGSRLQTYVPKPTP